MTAHDQLFKDLLEQFFPDLLRIVVPRIANHLALDSQERIHFLKDELFTDLPDGKRRQVDLLAQVPTRKGPEKLVLVHVEIERQARASMARRLGRYAMALQLRHSRPVLPIVLFLKGGPPGGPHRKTYEVEIFGESLMSFTYWQLSLSSATASQLLERDEPLAWALAALTRGGELSPAHHKLACMTRIARSSTPLSQAHQYLLLNCVETYVQLDPVQEKELQDMLEKKALRDVLEIYDSGVTWADRMREKALNEARERGLSEGRAKGRAEGVPAGERRLLLRQLELRFGPLPDTARKRVEALEAPEDLEDLGERLLTAKSLDDLGLT